MRGCSWFGLGDTKKIVVLLTSLTVWSNYFYKVYCEEGRKLEDKE